jgi:hypothetical protein
MPQQTPWSDLKARVVRAVPILGSSRAALLTLAGLTCVYTVEQVCTAISIMHVCIYLYVMLQYDRLLMSVAPVPFVPCEYARTPTRVYMSAYRTPIRHTHWAHMCPQMDLTSTAFFLELFLLLYTLLVELCSLCW